MRIAPGYARYWLMEALPGLAPGTFTVAPNAISDEYPPNLLWHPIKG